MVAVSKNRLLEIEKELNGLTIQDMARMENLSIAATLPRTESQLKANSNNIKNFIKTERFKEVCSYGGKIGASVNRKNKTGMWAITNEQRSQQSKKNQDFYTTCPHCGRTEKGSFFVRVHIPNCVLQYISVEDFIQEWNNPTITRDGFAKRIGLSAARLYKFKNELTANGLM